MRMDLDALDARLIAALRRDSRARILTLAKELVVPKSTVHDRLRKLKRAGVSYRALLQWDYLGCSLVVCFVAPYNEKLVHHPNVNTCLRLSPEALFLECVFATMADVEAFRQELKGGKVYPVVTILKKEGFVPSVDPVPL